MPVLNYTTDVPAERTISEIQQMLLKHGVLAMMTEYDGPHVAAVSLKMNIDGRPMGFKMPCNWRAVREMFKKYNASRVKRNGSWQKKIQDSDEQAIRTAWRVIKDWIEAQLALVEINMVTIPQIFLPYAIMKDGRTLSEHAESGQLLLG